MVVVLDYRLYPAVRYPAFLQDAAQAVAWTRSHIATYGGDPESLVLMGHSAGAYNAAMLTLDPDFLQAARVQRGAIRGMVGLAGPYDFLPLKEPALQRIVAPAGDLRLTQPVTYADGRNPPMLLIHGRDDSRVRPGNSLRLAERVRGAGGPAWPLRSVGVRIWLAWWADLRDASRRHRVPIHRLRVWVTAMLQAQAHRFVQRRTA